MNGPTTAPGPAAPRPSRRASTLIQPRKLGQKELLLRGLIILVNLTSISLLWWQLQGRLLPLQRRVRTASALVARLESEVSRMSAAWPTNSVLEVLDQFAEVKTRMFDGRTAMGKWVAGLQQQVVPLALEVDLSAPTQASAAGSPAATNAPAIPPPTHVVMSLRPAPDIEAIAPAFQRVLQLAQRLTHDEKRADLTGLTIGGGARSVSRATFELDLWAASEQDPP